jgi:hypothetical protein
VKLFLDAHISARRIAAPLRDQGHDVRAADDERELDGSTDEALLSLAASEGRIFITFDVKDFPLIVRRWAEAGVRTRAVRSWWVSIMASFGRRSASSLAS